jgi:hypothetical protein
MSLTASLSRIAELQSLLSGAPAAPAATSPGATPFPAALQSAMGPLATAAVAPGSGTVGDRIVAIAQREVGVAEQPPGSNDHPRIAQYRTATAGSMVAPWCAYFTSWAAREAGAPIGPGGQGMGAVDGVWSWAQQTGKAIPQGSGPPQPGDLIVWDEHIGIVESVLPDGQIQTIEGNSSNAVSRRVHPAGDAIGYVRVG